jgi:hypothetical protein
MPKKKMTLVLLASVIALLSVTGANAQVAAVEPLPPYVGVIKNNCHHDISVPSENSLATLIVPARSWIEFVVWDPKFDLIPYREGKPFHCQKVTVNPDAFPFMCKNYDFMVEICPPGLDPTKDRYRFYKKYKKRYRKTITG